MTALSVHSRTGGATNANPAAAAAAVSAARTAPFAATPPATTSSARLGPRPASSPSHARPGPPAPRPPRAESLRRCPRPPASAMRPAPCRATSCATAVFSPEKLKSQPGRPSIGRGKAKRRGSPASRQPLQRRPARPAQAEQLRHLVERLAGRIVHRAAQPHMAPHPFHRDALAVPARHQQQQIGKLGPARAPVRAAGRSAHAPPDGSPRRRAAGARSRCPWRTGCRRSARRSAPARRWPPPRPRSPNADAGPRHHAA